MQTDIRTESKQGSFEKMVSIFDDQESREKGIYNFKFDENDIMRSELIKFLIKRLNSVK